VAFSGQKTYNGVAILARSTLEDVVMGIPAFDDPQKRVISATVDGVRLVCAYVPNGESVESAKYPYKLDWLARFSEWLAAELLRHPSLAVLGDYNIAPDDRDVYDPVAWAGKVLCSEPERSAFRGIIGLGLSDAFRMFDQPERSWSWWDYRMNMYRRKLGLRIDHILLSANSTFKRPFKPPRSRLPAASLAPMRRTGKHRSRINRPTRPGCTR
jgi:exodeoxyribonuclease-3